MACSDGGAESGKGSFGWALREKGSEFQFLVGIGGVDGKSPSSYRSECAGVLSVMCAWDCLRNDGIIGEKHKITLFCDNQGVVSIVNKILKWPYFPLPRDASEADLLYCIKYIADRCRSAFRIEWVKSHQDERKDCTVENLSKEARLNIEQIDSQAWHFVRQYTARWCRLKHLQDAI